MGYRVGVDVGGTFTDVLLIDTTSGDTWRAKTASTPEDQSIGVLRGIERVCAAAGVGAGEIGEVLHGTTIATNAILEGKGAKVGLVTTQGFRQVLQIARSYVPGGLAGWIIWPKPEPLAALENTVEAIERVDTHGAVVTELDEDDIRAKLRQLRSQRHRGAVHQPDQLLRQCRPRESHRRDRRAGAARRTGLAVLDRAAGVPRVRAHDHHGRQRVRAAAGVALRVLARVATARHRRDRRAVDPAQRRRAGQRPGRRREPRRAAAVRTGRWRHRRGLGRGAGRASPTSSPSTWAARRPTSAWCRTSSRASVARPRWATSRFARPRWTCGPSAPAADRSPTCPR